MSARFFAIESLFLIICSNIDLLKGQVELNLPVLHLKVLQAPPLLHLIPYQLLIMSVPREATCHDKHSKAMNVPTIHFPIYLSRENIPTP
jgi:hypothetical protein